VSLDSGGGGGGGGGVDPLNILDLQPLAFHCFSGNLDAALFPRDTSTSNGHLYYSQSSDWTAL